MHNAHFIICNGSDVDDVRCKVENLIEEWGNENNWFNIDEIVEIDDMNEEYKEYVQKALDDLNNEFSNEQIEKTKKDIQYCLDHASDEQRHYYWQLSDYAKNLYEMLGHKDDKITIDNLAETNNFNGYQYDEFGLTNIYDEDDEEPLYFVEIDVHS